jgi:hypothetical protein
VPRSNSAFVSSLSLVIVFASAATAQERTRPTRSTAQEERKPAGPAPVVVKDGRLTVSVDRVSAQWLLDEIARQASVRIENTTSFATHPVSIAFEDVALDEGLRRILVAFDAFFFYAASDKGGARLETVWVYPKGHGATLAPVPPDQWASTSDLERALTDPDADVRSDAIDELVDRKGARAIDQVLQALHDPDESVRLRALDAAAGQGLELPEAEVQTLVLGDASADVRLAGLEILAESPKVKSIAEAALADSSQEVRERAAAILQELKTRPRTPGGGKEVR